ncbi:MULTISPECIES: hypothetical protein [unclassified Halorubrum]|uniref:helix-turn-helix transcriptional regulator n=1 Tax=unclassified Halorubrum TaxID=2642239 RepID=UPI000B994D2B|nr:MULTISPECIES: hypothetical protein [unclassified Halorubrum]OYR47181.1 hypothetical protein DJ75_04565 [Halorubrum sp. Eb13]OYR55147.1 hypothetical protein DJ73_03415 [Halorubrum sp. Ea1]
MQRTVLLLVVALVASAGLASVGAAQTGAGLPSGGFDQMDVSPDDVLIAVTVEPDGDAVWETQYRIRLADDDEEQAFEELRADVESDPDAYTSRFGERMRTTAGAAENATGREMNVTNVSVSAERRELPQSYGVLTYRFEWSNFAAVDGDRLLVGDAVDALFLDESTSLIVSWEDGYRLGEASPTPTETRDDAVVWQGPVDFTEGEPRVTIEQEEFAAGALPFVALGLLVAIVAVVGYRRRPWGASASGETPVASAESTEPGATTSTAADGASASPDSASGEDDVTSDSAAGEDESGTDADEDADGAAPPVDEDLLSNEEQVIRLVEENGGRVKQKRVAEELDWTAAKTSQVVTGLRDDGDLDGFRLGRENVLSLPEYDAAGGGDADGEADGTTDEREE